MRRGLLLPVFFVTYALAYVDRANYGFGAAAGLAQTLHITDGRSALLGALFFLGYFAFQIPGMLAARRFSATRLVFVALILWGTFAALTGVIHSFAWLAVDRLLLGIAESIVFPAMLFLLTRWFTRAERSRANTALLLGNPVTVLAMSTITGFLIERFGWQHTFILEGAPAIVWAFVWIAVVRDEPALARWINPVEAERLAAEIALEHPATRMTSTPSPGGAAQLRAMLFRPDVLLLSLQYFCWSLGVYGFVLWLPTIVRGGTAFSMGQTGLLSAIPYALAIVLMIVVARASDRTLRRQELVWPFLLLAGFAMLGSFLAAAHSFVLAFVCLVVAGGAMYAPYGPFFAIIPERVPPEAVGEIFAMVNSCGALGGFAGSYLVGLLHAITGTQSAGYLLMSLSLLASALLLLRLPPVPASSHAREFDHA
jgi:sugar phosphate permease